MAILANDTVRTVLQIVLAIVIVVLGYVLFRSIREPAEEFEREQALTEITRERMSLIRDAMRAYERRYDRYPTTLDSLAMAIETDSFFVAKRDSIFDLMEGETINPDSILVSPRDGLFDLTVVPADTTGPSVYLLEDPASDDFIGTDDPTRAAGMLNAASWE